MIIIPYSPEHGEQIDLQEKQVMELPFILSGDHAKTGYAFTGMHEGRVVFCAGRAYGHGAWAMLSREASKHMLAVTRCIKRLIYLHSSDPDESKIPMEAMIRNDFPEAHRWAAMLGFEKTSEDGEHSIYTMRGA